MSLRTSVKSRSLISSSQPSEAGKSRRQSSCSPSLSSRPSTRMRRTPSRATATAHFFLGGKKKSTLKEISEVLGKETIDLYNTSETRSNNNSYGLNYQKTGKELMSQDEIAVMDGAKCILQLRGVRPFLSNKYDKKKKKKNRLSPNKKSGTPLTSRSTGSTSW